MRRVLIVDDEQNLRHMLQTLLKREGYEPVGVASVEGALRELSDRPYDIVITDLRMPGQSGMDLVDEIRRRNLGATVVAMTAYGSRDIAIEAMKRGGGRAGGGCRGAEGPRVWKPCQGFHISMPGM